MEPLLRLLREYPVVVDFLLFFLVFAAAGRAAFSQKFPGRDGRVLALALGLLLASSLVAARHTLGFSVETIGLFAAALLCLVVTVLAYAALLMAKLPKLLSALLASLAALLLVRSIAPKWLTPLVDPGSWSYLIPILLLIGVGGYFVERRAASIYSHRPGEILARSRYLPSDDELAVEKRVLRRGILRDSQDAARDQRHLCREVQRLESIAERGGLTSKEREQQAQYLAHALARAERIRRDHERVKRLVAAVEAMDHRWLRRTYSLELRHLTPDQAKLVRRVIEEERMRIGLEDRLRHIESDLEQGIRQLETALKSAQASLKVGNEPGTAAWATEALKVEDQLRESHKETIAIEKKLLQQVRRQLKELSSN